MNDNEYYDRINKGLETIRVTASKPWVGAPKIPNLDRVAIELRREDPFVPRQPWRK